MTMSKFKPSGIILKQARVVVAVDTRFGHLAAAL
jgi:ADP-heptose:LPS heptosyltransferase